MSEEKKLDEKTLQDVSGGLRGEAIDGMYAGLYYKNNCLDCARAHKDCPYNDDVEVIYHTFGRSRPSCHS